MTLLTARDYHRIHPTDGTVFDALGREIPWVAACNTVTGEVIRLDVSLSPLLNCIRWTLLRDAFSWLCITTNPEIRYSVVKRHGFWPAPLRIVPAPAATLAQPTETE